MATCGRPQFNDVKQNNKNFTPYLTSFELCLLFTLGYCLRDTDTMEEAHLNKVEVEVLSGLVIITNQTVIGPLCNHLLWIAMLCYSGTVIHNAEGRSVFFVWMCG